MLSGDSTHEARLKRLEQAVFGEQPHKTNALDDGVANQHVLFSASSENVRNTTVDEDTKWLETIGVRYTFSDPDFVIPHTVELEDVAKTLRSAQHTQARRLHIPPLDLAMAALNIYSEHLDAAQHVMHVDSARESFDLVYSQIELEQTPSPGRVALILAVCSTIGFYQHAGFQLGALIISDHDVAAQVSMRWAREALAAIEQTRVAVESTGLEALQAAMILVFLFYHLEGLTFRTRMLHASCIAMARDLGLHKTDASVRQPTETLQADLVEKEVRRKMWWHVACTDWWEAAYTSSSSMLTRHQVLIFHWRARRVHVYDQP